MDTKGRLVADSHNRHEFVLFNADEIGKVSGQICQICADDIEFIKDEEPFVACNECALPICRPCYEYERREGNQACPQSKTRFKRIKGSPRVDGDEDEDGFDGRDSQHMSEGVFAGWDNFDRTASGITTHSEMDSAAVNSETPLLRYGREDDKHALIVPPFMGRGNRIHPMPYTDSSMTLPPRPMDPKKDLAVYGYRTRMQKPDYYSKPLLINNQYQALDSFPPLSFAEAIRDSSSIFQSTYFSKPNIQHITPTIFTQVQSLTILKKTIQNYFPEDFQWYSDDTRKTQKFYEFILVDSNSVDLFHYMDPETPDRIAYSKCIIKKVLGSEEWTSPFSERNFSRPFYPEGYTYPDYKTAWFKMFFIRSFDHSWLFTFDLNFVKTAFPAWFLEWWFEFGPLPCILPPEVRQALNLFTHKAPGEQSSKDLFFYAEFKVPWILCWSYSFKQHYPKPFPISIVREIKIKWWKKYSIKYCNPLVVQKFLSTGEKPKFLSSKKHAPRDKPTSSGLSQGEIKLFKLLCLQYIKLKKESGSNQDNNFDYSRTIPAAVD